MRAGEATSAEATAAVKKKKLKGRRLIKGHDLSFALIAVGCVSFSQRSKHPAIHFPLVSGVTFSQQNSRSRSHDREGGPPAHTNQAAAHFLRSQPHSLTASITDTEVYPDESRSCSLDTGRPLYLP